MFCFGTLIHISKAKVYSVIIFVVFLSMSTESRNDVSNPIYPIKPISFSFVFLE